MGKVAAASGNLQQAIDAPAAVGEGHEIGKYLLAGHFLKGGSFTTFGNQSGGFDVPYLDFAGTFGGDAFTVPVVNVHAVHTPDFSSGADGPAKGQLQVVLKGMANREMVGTDD